MKIKKYVWGAVSLVFVSLLVAAICVGGGASVPALAQALVSFDTPCVPHPGAIGQDLVSWWPADTSAQDVIGGNDGILRNGATAGDPGMVGKAFTLDGVGDFVEIPNNAGLNPSAITVDAWVNPTANSFFPSIVSKGNVGTFAESYALFLTPTGQPGFLVNTNGTSTGRALLIATTPITLGAWTHLAGTYDGAMAKLYVNGVLGPTVAHTGAIQATPDPVLIGKSDRTGAGPGLPTSFLNGKIDEPEIYKTALSAGDISSIFTAGAAGKCKKVQWDIVSINFLTSTVSSGGKAEAEANDDSEIKMTGSGTFTLGSPDSVMGGGTWKIRKEVAPDVEVTLGSGTYAVQSLVRFVEAPGTFSLAFIDAIDGATKARAGLAILRIKYSDGSPGILVVSCHLTGTRDNVFEGITASKGNVDFFKRQKPEADENENRTIFHVVVQ